MSLYSFLVNYDDAATPITLNCESLILELKDLICSSFQTEFNSISIFLEKYGQIDTTEMLELPLSILSLPEKEVNQLFILDQKKKKQFYRIFCTRKLIGFNPISQLGFLINNTIPICLACSIFCRKGEYSLNSAQVGQEFICKCSTLKNHKCVFCDMPNLSTNASLSFEICKTILDEHASALIKYERMNKERKLNQYHNRDIKYEKEIQYCHMKVKKYDNKKTKEKILSIVPKRTEEMKDHDYVKTLLKWFKYDFFSWCNKPKCTICGKDGDNMVGEGTEKSNEEESKFLAYRTEVFNCINCGIKTRFPRYNNPIKLLETKTGRCGEYANLFGCILNAVGFKVRFINNFEDHVWNEFYSEIEKRWIHLDSCENAFDQPLLYEQGWGRVMTFIIGASIEEVVDVTPRYIKNWETCQERRSKVNEEQLQELLEGTNISLSVNLTQEKQTEILHRHEEEVKELKEKKTKERQVQEAELKGRQSGSVEWRKQRGELK